MFAAFIVALVFAAGGQVSFGAEYGFPWWLVRLPDGGLETGNSIYLRFAVNALLLVNIFWGVVNLLPVYPLDGGQIAREVLVRKDPWGGVRNSLWVSVITGGAVAVSCLLWFGQPYIAIMFGLLAFSSWQALQQMTGGGGFGGPWGGGRPW